MEESNFIIRKIDDLGRIVIPRDKRKEIGIAIKDKFKVHTEEKEIILRKINQEESYYIRYSVICFLPDERAGKRKEPDCG